MRSKPLAGRNAKNPDGTSRLQCRKGAALGTTRAGDGAAGNLAKDTEQGCPVGARQRFKAVRGTNGEARRALRSTHRNESMRAEGEARWPGCHAMKSSDDTIERDGMQFGCCCGRSSTLTNQIKSKAWSAVRSRVMRGLTRRRFSAVELGNSDPIISSADQYLLERSDGGLQDSPLSFSLAAK